MSSYTPAGGLLETQVVTVSGNVTAPLWAVFADVELIGGGGGGGGAGSQATAGAQQNGGGGGGAGQWLPIKGIPVTGGTVYPVSIGAGGTGGAGGAADGNAGADGSGASTTTAFGYSATGGGGGDGSPASSAVVVPGGYYAMNDPYIGENEVAVPVPGYGGSAYGTNSSVLPFGPVVGGGAGMAGAAPNTALGGGGGLAATVPGQTLTSSGQTSTASGTDGESTTVPGCGGAGGGGGAGTTGAGGNGGDGANGQVTITWRSE